jgi:phytoene synthase
VHALYGYVRAADELVDGPRRASDPGERRARLDAWERALDDGRRRGAPSHPVIVAPRSTPADRPRPAARELKVYMPSCASDCGPLRIRLREELER